MPIIVGTPSQQVCAEAHQSLAGDRFGRQRPTSTATSGNEVKPTSALFGAIRQSPRNKAETADARRDRADRSPVIGEIDEGFARFGKPAQLEGSPERPPPHRGVRRGLKGFARLHLLLERLGGGKEEVLDGELEGVGKPEQREKSGIDGFVRAPIGPGALH